MLTPQKSASTIVNMPSRSTESNRNLTQSRVKSPVPARVTPPPSDDELVAWAEEESAKGNADAVEFLQLRRASKQHAIKERIRELRSRATGQTALSNNRQRSSSRKPSRVRSAAAAAMVNTTSSETTMAESDVDGRTAKREDRDREVPFHGREVGLEVLRRTSRCDPRVHVEVLGSDLIEFPI